MKLVPQLDAQEHANAPTCKVFEYEMGDTNINGAVAVINGRYPEAGFAVNRECKELVFVIHGSGKLATREAHQELFEGDMALIDKNEEYYFEGKQLVVHLACTPAWTPEQYEEVST